MTRPVVLSLLLLAGVLTTVWSQAQQAAPATQPDPANFTGRVTGHATADIRMNRYSFEPGARTNWHSHADGQAVYVERGRARVQERGRAMREVGPREAFTVAPGVVHWHGATPDAPLTQVSLSFGATTWLEPVTDAQYAGR